MMLTRCPNCVTSFRVTAEQLKVKQGRVRCGQCQKVFNALDTLIDEPEPAPLPVKDFPATVMEPFPPTEPAPPIEEQAEAESEIMASETIEPTLELSDAAPADDVPELPKEYPNWPNYLEDNYPTPAYDRNRRHNSWLWGGAAFLAALLLSVQILVHFRTELSVSFPAVSSLMMEGCALLGIDLPLPHKADLLGIETSDLHPGSDEQLVLAATLKNRAAFAQAYPHLELTLTDLGDQALLRKVLAPADYLPPGIDAGAGFAANGELAFNLALEAGVSGASGYRIYLFYP